MNTRQIRSVRDFARHRRDMEVICYCGHKAVLPYRPVISLFVREGWPTSLGSAAKHFRCSKCGSIPRILGPDGA